jgi:hypothetical protein
MTTRRDPDRVIRAFLAEGQTDLPDRSYDAVRSGIERTRQRVVIGPWRLTEMNAYIKLAIAAAAAVVVAVVGINLLGTGDGQTGGPTATASPSPSPTLARTPGPTPVARFPREGPMAPGTYTAIFDAIPVSFTVEASDWSVYPGNGIGNDLYGEPGGIGFNFWLTAPDNVYSDPCAHTPLSPAPSHTAADLIAAAAGMPGVDVVTGPSSTTLGGRLAQTVAFTIRDDIGCDPTKFYLWYLNSAGGPEGGYRWAGALGSTHQAWAADVDGKVVWIDSETFAGQGPEIATMVQQFIDAIQFE